MTLEEMRMLAKQYVKKEKLDLILGQEAITDIVNAACSAPSTGNDQTLEMAL